MSAQRTNARPPAIVRQLGLKPYETVWQQMRNFTNARTSATADEIWIVEHPAVFTLGQAGLEEHVLDPGDIPVVRCDRGGQVTYHGPGQLLAYTLIDLRRAGVNVRQLVEGLEQSVIDVLATLGIDGRRRAGAPGIYVGEAKISALGLRVRKGCSYHGLSLNVEMDLLPFERINPCGFPDLSVTDLRHLGVCIKTSELAQGLVTALTRQFGLDVVAGDTLTALDDAGAVVQPSCC